MGILGFVLGLRAGAAGEGSKAEVGLVLQLVLWVAFVSAGLLGAGLGTVATVGLEMAGKVTVGAAIITPVTLRVVLQHSSSLGARSCTGAALGTAAAAWVSLGATSVAAKQEFGSRNSALTILGSVMGGVLVALKCVALKATALTTSELLTVGMVAVGGFLLGAPRSPFHTQVKLRRALLTGSELIKDIGMETVTAAASPIGAVTLGTAALGTATLGTLGTVGVVLAVALALGSAHGGTIGKSPTTTSSHPD